MFFSLFGLWGFLMEHKKAERYFLFLSCSLRFVILDYALGVFYVFLLFGLWDGR